MSLRNGVLLIQNIMEFYYLLQAHTYNKMLHKLIDPLLGAKEHERSEIMECVRVALLCIHHLAKHRPTMSEVVTMLGRIKVVQGRGK
jgi:hypothetical protein